MSQVDLSRYNNSWFNEGAGALKRTAWFVTNALFFINPLNPFSGLKVRLLRLFGARIGKGVVIKPSVNIKYPWNLTIGNYTWIGEKVWIDNLDKVTIGSNCCLSQEAMLLIGNHDYKSETFDLMVAPIILEDGVWLGAKSMVTGGVTCHNQSILSVHSIASNDLDANFIYRGNPASKVKQRRIS
ncbi:WcaF family extracellular polysaccharide biosynthesis acetyltransferase [Carboxylicivirga sp. N1Y90]|uniref:WcaF family extracellular polysaccharide biosynthesis acetyltransferase n=1 Tax=Carboxylicivirga fragile TaxID=3417571 RepID=UPI003D3571B6|nr:WcaF family extracellular polysaccharide biosynthesis acetyltransferase [Marinilabiliaceae bacterium N1Y90]